MRNVLTELPSGMISFDAPPAGTFDAIFQALDASSRDLIGPVQPQLLAIPLNDDQGVVVGGFWGCTLFRWLHVQLLFIPESLRGKGVGSALMTTAETEARRRGCIGAHVTSFSFQAVPFYEKLGYIRFGRLDNYPPGHNLLYLRKQFDTPAVAAEPISLADARKQQALNRARLFAINGEDDAAKCAYVDVLRIDATDFSALNEIGALACAGGHRAAARTAYAQAVQYHPENPTGRVNLGNLLFEDGEIAAAQVQFEAALAVSPELAEAHQGMARVLSESDADSAEQHRNKGYAGHAVVTKPYRGIGQGVPLLLLVSAYGGNIPTRHWIDDRHFAVSAIHAEYHDPAQPLPPHALVVNAIGDAERCSLALERAEQTLAASTAPVINLPARVRATARNDNARRLAGIPDVISPQIVTLPRHTIATADGLRFPLLLRSPGFHGGCHFRYVATRDALQQTIAELPGAALLVIEYCDARGPDGMARKYRAMCIDGVLYPWHLAVAAEWKVHYFSAAMAANPVHRDEERRFLDDMPGVLGPRAMTALGVVGRTLGLDYAGIDFALTRDGSLLVFEANATMVIGPPGPEPIWNYRRGAAAAVLTAAANLLSRRIQSAEQRDFVLTAPGC